MTGKPRALVKTLQLKSVFERSGANANSGKNRKECKNLNHRQIIRGIPLGSQAIACILDSGPIIIKPEMAKKCPPKTTYDFFRLGHLILLTHIQKQNEPSFIQIRSQVMKRTDGHAYPLKVFSPLLQCRLLTL